MARRTTKSVHSNKFHHWALGILLVLSLPPIHKALGQSQTDPSSNKSESTARKIAPGKRASHRPKLVVMLVVDQMRADYVDRFQFQWTGGFKRLVDEGAWFRDAAYPYAATETCVGHSTISTGALPATHGMIANSWFDRDSQKMVTCTSDPKAKNSGYAGIPVKGGDSDWRMAVPAFADELKFQSGTPTRVVTFSLKARASITMGGRKADAATWFDGATGALTTSDSYPTVAFIEEYAKEHPVKGDIGKTWALTLSENNYLYEEKATNAGPPAGWTATFPHPLRAKDGTGNADPEFYEQWSSSPFADTYLTNIAETAVSKLGLGSGAGTDYLGISYSSVDYVGHAFGPRSREIQDILIRLDQDLGELFSYLDSSVGRGNYVIALSADHGVAPIPEDLKKFGDDAGWLNMAEVRERVESAIEKLNYPKPAIAGITDSTLYFSDEVYDRLKKDSATMKAVFEAIESVPGVAGYYTREEVEGRTATNNPIRAAYTNSYFPGRSGDLVVVPKPYWPVTYFTPGRQREGGTTHGTPYYYDQRVPLFFMGWGIQSGHFHGNVTPADIAPTLASLCGITLATRDGHVLSEALIHHSLASSKSKAE
jgi:predicted AlkP superfamily pyrophosphatase or phosphodiesterase